MTIKIQDLPNRAAFDVKSAQDLRTQFSKNPQEGLKAAAQQFETLFLQMVMKSMRDAVPQDGLFNSDQSRFYTGMLDQQMAQNLATSGKGVGFARLIEQQLGRNIPGAEALSAPVEAANAAGNALPLNASDGRHLNYKTVLGSLPTSAAYAASIGATAGTANADAPATSKEFVNRVWPHAVEVSRSTGIPPQFLVAHSALESGWGKSVIRQADGSSSRSKWLSGFAPTLPTKSLSVTTPICCATTHVTVRSLAPRVAQSLLKDCNRQVMPLIRCMQTNSRASSMDQPCARH